MIQSIGTSNFTATDLDRFAEELNRDGICVIRGLFDQELIEQWADAFNALFQERQNRPGGLAPRGQARYYLTLPWVKPFAYSSTAMMPIVFCASLPPCPRL